MTVTQRRRPTRRSSFAIAILTLAFAAPTSLGCRDILGIEDLPDDNSVVPEGGAGDASAPGADATTGSAQPTGDAAPDHAVAAADAASDAVHAGADAAPAAARLTTNQTSLDFGTVTQGQTVGNGVVQINNAGTIATGPLTTSLTGAAPFSIALDNCAGRTLAPALSCTVAIALATGATGTIAGGITIGESSADFASESLAAKIVTGGVVTVNPVNVDFGGVGVLGVSAPTVLTVRNSGISSTGALVIALGGANASEFSLADGCGGQRLAAAATCSVSVTFTPQTAGPKTASLTVTDPLGGTGATSLSGTGLAPASITITPTSFTFPEVALFDAGTPVSETFVVTNGGDLTSAPIASELDLASMTAASELMIVADGCNYKTIAAMSSCDVTVQFHPATHGQKSASLVVGGAVATVSGLVEDLLTVTVAKTGTGDGTVSDPSGVIDCGSICTGQFARTVFDPVINLTATPNASSVFSGWTDSTCSGTANPCVLTVDTAMTTSARFDMAQ